MRIGAMEVALAIVGVGVVVAMRGESQRARAREVWLQMQRRAEERLMPYL